MLEGGWRTRPYGAWVFGAQVAYEEGHVTDDSAFLKDHRVDDPDSGASIGVHAEGDWNLGAMPLNALVRYRQNIDSDQGAQADLRLTAGILSRWGVEAGVFGQLTWANGKSTQSYFGITPQQSVITGLPAYDAGSGLRYVQLGLLGPVILSAHWLIPWGASMQRQQGDASDSPLVQDRTNWTINAGIAYRFGPASTVPHLMAVYQDPCRDRPAVAKSRLSSDPSHPPSGSWQRTGARNCTVYSSSRMSAR